MAEDSTKDRDLKGLEYNWTITGNTSDTITIKLDFDNPIEVSTLEKQDVIKITFKNRLEIFSPTQKRFLHKSSIHLRKALPKQISDTPLTRSVKSATDSGEAGMKIIFLIAFILNLVLTGGFEYFIMMIRVLQMTLHLPMLQILVPANVIMVFQVIITIAMFDILENDYGIGLELFMNFDDKGQEEISIDIRDQIKDMGYGSHNTINNLSTLAILIVLYFFKLIILFLIKVVATLFS